MSNELLSKKSDKVLNRIQALERALLDNYDYDYYYDDEERFGCFNIYYDENREKVFKIFISDLRKVTFGSKSWFVPEEKLVTVLEELLSPLSDSASLNYLQLAIEEMYGENTYLLDASYDFLVPYGIKKTVLIDHLMYLVDCFWDEFEKLDKTMEKLLEL